MINRQEKIGAVISYFTTVFYLVTGFLYTTFLIRKLGLSDYGLYTLSASIIAYFSIDFGISTLQTRMIARYRAEGNEHKVKDLLGITAKLYLIIDIILFIALITVYFFSEQIFIRLTPEEMERFRTIFLISSVFVLFNFPTLPVQGIFVAYEKIINLKLFDLCAKFVSMTLLFTVLFLGYGLFEVVVINAASTLAFQMLKVVYLYRNVGVRINIKYKDKQTLKTIGSFSMWQTIALVGNKMFFAIIPTLLAIFSDTRQIALFAVVIAIESYIFVIAKTLNGIFLPKVVKLLVDNKSAEVQTNLMIKVGRIQLYILGCMVASLVGLGREFFRHWLGEGFDVSYYAMLFVIVPCLFHFTQTIAEEIIYAQNKVKYRAIVYTCGSIISTVVIVLLAPRWGAMGAAVGVFLGFVLANNLMMNIFYKRKLNINVGRFFRECHLRILPAIIVAAAAGWIMQQYITTPSFISFAAKGCLWVAVYFVLLWIMAFNGEEKAMVKQSLHMFRI